MSHNLKKCLPLIESYTRIRNKALKAKFLKQFEDCIIKATQEMSVNTLQGNVTMTSNQKKRLRRYKKALIALSKHSVPRFQKKRIILQSGSGIFAALLPLIVSAIAGAVSK